MKLHYSSKNHIDNLLKMQGAKSFNHFDLTVNEKELQNFCLDLI
jgi:hypothetical protein